MTFSVGFAFTWYIFTDVQSFIVNIKTTMIAMNNKNVRSFVELVMHEIKVSSFSNFLKCIFFTMHKWPLCYQKPTTISYSLHQQLEVHIQYWFDFNTHFFAIKWRIKIRVHLRIGENLVITNIFFENLVLMNF